MNTSELIALFRADADDGAEPYLWSDASVLSYLNDAVDEACRRKDLLFDKTTAAVCTIDVDDTAAVYSTSEKIVRITAAYLTDSSDDRLDLYLCSRSYLDSYVPTWRDLDGDPMYLVVEDQSVELIPAPEDDYTLSLEVYRRPLSTEQLSISPEVSPAIAEEHHRHLVEWALYRAYRKRDANAHDPNLARAHLSFFEEHFGGPMSAGMATRITADRPHRNKGWQ